MILLALCETLPTWFPENPAQAHSGLAAQRTFCKNQSLLVVVCCNCTLFDSVQLNWFKMPFDTCHCEKDNPLCSGRVNLRASWPAQGKEGKKKLQLQSGANSKTDHCCTPYQLRSWYDSEMLPFEHPVVEVLALNPKQGKWYEVMEEYGLWKTMEDVDRCRRFWKFVCCAPHRSIFFDGCHSCGRSTVRRFWTVSGWKRAICELHCAWEQLHHGRAQASRCCRTHAPVVTLLCPCYALCSHSILPSSRITMTFWYVLIIRSVSRSYDAVVPKYVRSASTSKCWPPLLGDVYLQYIYIYMIWVS